MKEKLTRRNLIRVGVETGAATALVGSWPYFGSLLSEEAPTVGSLNIEDYSLNNNQLRVVQSNHDEVDWIQYKSQIEEEISNASLVIPEYFPPEYSQLRHSRNPIYKGVSRYNKANGLFDHIADFCIENAKPILAVDPEHDESGANLHYLLNLPGISLEIAGLVLFAEKGREYVRKERSRRDILKISGISLAPAVGLTGNLVLAEKIEDDFRNVVSAELLDKFDREPNLPGVVYPISSRQMTMFIPKAHWNDSVSGKGIKSYLADTSSRKERLQLYTDIFARELPSLFEGRLFEPANKSGTPTIKFSLLA